MNQSFQFLLKNTTWLLIGKIVGLGLSLLISVYLAKIFGASGYGQFALIFSYVVVLQVVCAFGMDTILTRIVAINQKRPFQEQISAGLLVQLVVAVVLICSLIPLSELQFNRANEFDFKSLILFLFILFPSAFITTFSAILKGQERMSVFAFFDLFEIVLRAFLILTLINESLSIKNVVLIFLTTKTLLAVLLGFYVYLVIKFRFEFVLPTRANVRKLIKSGGYIVFAVMIITLFRKLEIIIISVFGGDEEAGLFAVSNRLLDVAKMVPAAFYGALFPVMVKGGHGMVSKRLSYVSYSSMLVLTLLLFFFSDILIELFELTEYSKSVQLIQILVFGLLPFAIRQYYSFLFIAKGLEKQVLLINLTSLILATILYPILYQSFGIVGICWSVNTVLAIESLIYFFYKRKYSLFFT